MDALTISAGVQGRHVFLESNVLVAISPSCCQLAVHEAGGWSLLLRRVVTAAAAAAGGCNLHPFPEKRKGRQEPQKGPYKKGTKMREG